MLRIDTEEKVTHDVHHSWLKATPTIAASDGNGDDDGRGDGSW